MTKRHRRKQKRAPESGDEQIAVLGGDRPVEAASEPEDFKLNPPPSPASVPPPVLEGSESVAAAEKKPSVENPEASLEELLVRGDFVRAISLVDAGLEETPNDLTLLLAAGRAHSALGDYPRAQVQLDRALEAWPDDLRIQREVGITLFRRGLYTEAAEALSIVCARSESDGEAYYYRGESLNRSGQTEDAMRTLEKAVLLAPYDGRVLRSLGRIYDRVGMTEQAADMYGRARQPSSQGS